VVTSGGLPLDDVGQLLANGPLAGLAPAAVREPAEPGAAGRNPAEPVWSGSLRSDHAVAADTAAVVLGGPAFALRDPRLAAAEVVLELLAGANASILIEEIRSKRGLSYDVSGGVSGFADTGVWRVAISTAPQQRDEVVDLATELVREQVARGWTEDEVALARRRVAGLLRLDTESSLEDAMLRGNYALVGGWWDWTLAQHLQLLAGVSADQVNDCARVMIEPLVIATAGGPTDVPGPTRPGGVGPSEGRTG
jgi:zinc protease